MLMYKMHIRTEANKSSRIEGTKTSIEEDMSDIEDISPEKRNDYIEVHNYINALNHGIYKITSGELPISSRLIKEIHSILLRGARGENISIQVSIELVKTGLEALCHLMQSMFHHLILC